MHIRRRRVRPRSRGASRTVALPVPAVDETQSLFDLTAFLLRQVRSRFRGDLGRQPIRCPLRPGDERVHLGELFLCGVAAPQADGDARFCHECTVSVYDDAASAPADDQSHTKGPERRSTGE